MKKIVILTIALALAVGMPLLASEFKFGGDLDWGFGSNFDNAFARADYNATFDAKATVDDINAVTVSIKHQRGTDTDVQTRLEKAQLATNLGNALKLPVAFTSYAGYFSFGSEEYASITGYDLSNLSESTGARWQWAADLNLVDALHLEVATNWDWTVGNNIFLGAHSVFGPLSAEVWYESTSSASVVGAALLAQLAVMEGSTLKVAAAFEDSIEAETYDLGAAVKFDIGMFGIGAGFVGDDVNFFDKASVELSVAPTANVGVDVGLELTPNLTDTLNNVDASVYYKAGAATWRVGYLYAPAGAEAADTWNAVDSGDGGGLFIKAGLDY